jgi:hypothetical protein
MTPTTRRVLHATVILAFLMTVTGGAALAISKKVIYRLHAAASEHYKTPSTMNGYSLMVYRGKAYAATRGTVDNHETVAIWEYVPEEWHLVFEHPLEARDDEAVKARYEGYGFTAHMQQKLLKNFKPFPQ